MDGIVPKVQKTGIYPSITALRMLDATARFGSLNKAADYLCVTPSAVSHQLRNLEKLIGTKLVRRIGRRAEITSAGNRYILEIRKALAIIAQASMPVSDEEPSGRLFVNCASGFGTYWLAQNIGDFQKLYPDIFLHVTTSSDKIGVQSDEIDFSILYGDGSWPAINIQLLYTPKFFPVCSPKLFETLGQISTPSDIAKYPLIHHENYSNWSSWLAAANNKSVKVESGAVFSDVNHSISAAMAGHGIAMGDDVLAGRAIAQGTLIRLFQTEIMAPKSYYIAVHDNKMHRKVSKICIDWITSKFTEFQ